MTIKKRYTLIAAVLSVLIAATACAAPAVSTGSAETDTKAVESIEDASEEETEEASADEEAAAKGEEAKDADASEAADKEDAEEAAAGKSADDSTTTVASGEKTRTAVNRKRAFGPEKDPLDVRPTEEQEVKNAEIPYLNYYPRTEQMIENQLQEMASYMESNHTEAAHFLSRLPRFRYMSQMLDGTDDYYYWGEENEDGEPDGIGMAVYANNCYYYGSFEKGVRSGRGTWFQTFINGSRYSMLNNGILSHSFVGDWANDLPNGEGQEHLDFDLRYLEARVTTNVIGNFKNPQDVYVAEDAIYVADTDNKRVVRLTKDLKECTEILTSFEYNGSKIDFDQPYGVYVSSRNWLYVAEKAQKCILAHHAYEKEMKKEKDVVDKKEKK